MRLAAGTRIETSALLFDMDGTLVDSTPAIERVWRRWAGRVSIEADDLLGSLHGVRVEDIVRRFAPPGTDVAGEVAWLMAEEKGEVDGISAVAGAADLLRALPPARWGVVTSADRELATIRMRLAGLPAPEVLIAAEDVSTGKPDPEGYRRAAGEILAAGDDIVVFEDSAAGLDAGRAAGFRVIAVAATRHAPFPDSEIWIDDFSAIAISPDIGSRPISLTVI